MANIMARREDIWEKKDKKDAWDTIGSYEPVFLILKHIWTI